MSRPPVVGITHPLILKDGELFFLCDHLDRVEPDPALGLGLYHRDCRYLRRARRKAQAAWRATAAGL